MRKPVLIAAVVLFSCTVKKSEDTVVAAPVEEQDTVETKRYLYTDTAETETTVVYDSAATAVVEPPREEEEAGDTIEVDTTVYRWNLPVAADSVKEWKNNKAFSYVKDLDSLLKAEKGKKQPEKKQEQTESEGRNWLGDFFASSGLQFFLWMLAGGFVLFILYKLFVTEGAFKRSSRNLKTDRPEAEEEVITSESDFDRMIREAVEQRNFRLAVRYHYLQTLHTLADKNYVQLAVDKTNYSYVREIADYNKQNGFAALTLNYEYVWYGEFEVDEPVYQKLKTAFQSFNATI